MRARDFRARRGHYSLRDLVGLADIERLLTAHAIGEGHFPEIADDDDAPADDAVTSAASRPQPGDVLERRR
jgi:hypothetical protein